LTNDPIVPAAERTLRLVELLLERPDGWAPRELLVELDLSRSSLFFLLRGLKTLGYVEQAGARGRYAAGPRLRALRASLPDASQDLLAAFYQEAENPAIREAGAAGSGAETLALALPAGGSPGPAGWRIAAQVEGTALVRTVYEPGAVLADLPAAAQVMDPDPPQTVAVQGCALAPSGDALLLALPVCRDGRTPAAALLLAAPAFRWTPERLTAAYLDPLREMAAHLSYRMGAPFYAPYRRDPREGVQPAAPMNQEEIAAFLKGPYTARLACIRPDGRPHVIPVWQEWDGRDFLLIAWRGSQWAEYVQANPNVSLTVDEPWSPQRRVVVSGCAARQDDMPPGALDGLLQRMARRYLGRAAGVPREQVLHAFRIRPEALRGWQGLAQAPR
jgi:hypothetical protein